MSLNDFDTSTPLKAPTTAGEWDDGDSAPEESEEVEGDSTEDEEPEETEEESEEQEEEVSEEVDLEDEEQPAVEAEPEEVVEATPKAQKRIQKLVQEKNELKETLAALNATLAQQAQYQAQVAAQIQAQQQAKIDQQNYQAKMEALMQAGFNPSDPSHQFLLQYEENAQRQQQELQRVQQQFENMQMEARRREYYGSLDQAIDSTLANYGDIPAAQKEALRQQAYTLAYASQIEDPAQAAKLALNPIIPFLPKKVAKTAPVKKTLTPQEKEVHRSIATRGVVAAPAKGKGSNVSGRQPKRTIEQIEREIFTRGGEWD